MGLWDSTIKKALNFVGDAADSTVDKTVGLADATASVLSAPIGATLDVARLATGEDLDEGILDQFSTKKSLESTADLLVGDGTLTGWAISSTGHALDWTYRNAVENPIETGLIMSQHYDETSWAQAWDLATERNLGQSALLYANEVSNDFDWTKKLTDLGENPLSENWSAGVGAEDTKDVNAADRDAWTEFQKHSPFWSGLGASTIDIGASFLLDPALVALKGGSLVRGTKDALPSESEWDNLIGKIGYEDRPQTQTINGVEQPMPLEHSTLDEAGNPELVRVPKLEQAGWLDGKSPAEVYAGLGLKAHAYGDQIATVLARTNDISDVAARVNARRDIVATASGDLGALKRLRASADEGGELADVLSNAMQGKGTGSNLAYLADDARSAEIAAGKAAPVQETPQVVADVQRELDNQAGLTDWLYASMKPRDLRPTAKGERAVARLRGQGLGRDGTLHTGYKALDDTVNKRVLGKFKSSGSLTDEAIAGSREFDRTEALGLAGGRTYEASQRTWSRGPNSMPVTTNLGIKVAGWASGVAPVVKGAARASDALRGRVVQGSLNLEDAHLSVAVAQDYMRRAGVDPAHADSLLSGVVSAKNATERGAAIQRVENEAIRSLGQQHGLSDEFIRTLAERGTMYRDAHVTAIRGQMYSAHRATDAEGKAIRGDSVTVVDDDGAQIVPVRDSDGSTISAPVLNTQTINFHHLVDIDYAKRWLERDQVLGAVDRYSQRLRNPGHQVVRATELGFHSRATANSQKVASAIRAVTEDVNTWWKRGVLLPRLGYPIRNASEELLRAWAIGHGAANAERAISQASQEARALGDKAWRTSVPARAKLNLARQELDELKALRDDPEVVAYVKAINDEIRDLTRKRDAAKLAGADTAEHDAAIDFMRSMPVLTEHADWAEQIKGLESSVAVLEDGINAKVLPDSGTHTLPGHGEVRFPQAHHGTSGNMHYELTRGGGAFDQDVTGFSERTFSRTRGVGEPDVLQVRFDSAPDVVARHAQAWSWVLNKQIAQDGAARVALEKMARGEDGIAEAIEAYLRSPEGKAYRAGNPLRGRDTQAWAETIEQMVSHYVPSENLAKALLEGEVPKGQLVKDFDADVRPDVHMAGVESVVRSGASARKGEIIAGKVFKFYDEMSVQRATRHPMFTVFFNDEQSRLADAFLAKAKVERGDSAGLTVDDINTISDRSRKVATERLKRTFYNTSHRSSAAQQLRFIYPFFAAHQDSMTFWGRAFANNPAALRKLQLAFDVPRSVGLVVDENGEPVKPGEFPSGDHRILLQMPKAWGGPDPSDPNAKRGGFTLSESAFNVIMPNGSIINPGAGPLASVPVGYVQKKYAASDEELSQALKWFNPFGAPQGTADAFMPNPVQRARDLWNAHHDQNSREYLEMWSLYMNEAQVDFYKKNDRTPNKSETRELERDVSDKVKHTALLRTFAAVTSPAQPAPASALGGMIQEYRNLQERGRKENRGPFWAADTFLNTYGDAYIALTKSASENRAHLNPSTAAVRSLEAHEKLTEQTDPETWRIIVGPEGEGAFNSDAYRWMQDKAVGLADQGKLIDSKDRYQRNLDISVAAGWRAYNKMMSQLRAVAQQYGFNAVEDSPDLRELKKRGMADLADRFPDWSESRVKGSDYESTIVPSLETIANNNKLANDPGRPEIGLVREYLDARKAVQEALAIRAQAGGSGSMTAKSNADIAELFAGYIDSLAEKNIAFSDYAMPGLIERDPLYRPE